MSGPDLSGVEQLPQPDPRGILALRYLPDDLQRQEDSTAAADRDRWLNGGLGLKRHRFGFTRDATPAERLLLQHLGFDDLPDDLTTRVTYQTSSVRNRRWPTLEGSTTV